MGIWLDIKSRASNSCTVSEFYRHGWRGVDPGIKTQPSEMTASGCSAWRLELSNSRLKQTATELYSVVLAFKYGGDHLVDRIHRWGLLGRLCAPAGHASRRRPLWRSLSGWKVCCWRRVLTQSARLLSPSRICQLDHPPARRRLGNVCTLAHVSALPRRSVSRVRKRSLERARCGQQPLKRYVVLKRWPCVDCARPSPLFLLLPSRSTLTAVHKQPSRSHEQRHNSKPQAGSKHDRVCAFSPSLFP
jgi:hypothetical protein